jgi:tRNA A-37 threonylcarbamoyl transferase component Bud32/tetratricopeptide (TPR) repeat protein
MTDPFSALQSALASRYRLDGEVGQGGMATVYRCEDLKHDRTVALKVLRPEIGAMLGAERFLLEIRVTARLQHPHILPLLDSGEAAGLLYYVMPFVTGESLRVRLDRERQLPVTEAVRLAQEVAGALGCAHAEGVIHRDVKPENILLSGGRAILADFGIARAVSEVGTARLTETGLAIGTAAYMSPEQAAGERNLDARSDLYSLGAVLYEMLTGEPPYTGATPQAVLAKRFSLPVPSTRVLRETVPIGLDQAVQKALAKAPADRFASAAEFSAALAQDEAGPTGELGPGARRVARPWTKAWLIPAAGAVFLAAWLGLSRWATSPPLDAHLVAVLPFRVAAADSSLNCLHEGMVDLLGVKLSGEGGPRAIGTAAVLSAVQRVAGRLSNPVDPAAARAVGRLTGAGRVIDGAVIGDARHLVITASVVNVASGGSAPAVSVEGPADSLPGMIDQLTALMLAGEARVVSRLSVHTTTSLPALRAYLDGEVAYRGGHYVDAVGYFVRALRFDSTFALAAMASVAAGSWAGPAADFGGLDPMALAVAAQDRLSPQDRVLLKAMRTGLLTDKEQAARANPDNPLAWYVLGDEYFHFGSVEGVAAPLDKAAAAFRRELALDSSASMEALTHLVQIAAEQGDAKAVDQWASFALRSGASSEAAGFLRWLQAVATGNRPGRAALRNQFGQLNPWSLLAIVWGSQQLGRSLEDGDDAAAELRRRRNTREDGLVNSWVLALNRGQPARAAAYADSLRSHGSPVWYRWQVAAALAWDGDTVRAAEAMRALAKEPPRKRSDPDRGRVDQDACILAKWRLAHRDTSGVAGSIAGLRHTGAPPGSDNEERSLECATVLDAWVEVLAHAPDAAQRLERLDSLLATAPPMWLSPLDHRLLPRLWEQAGDIGRALAAARRRTYGLEPRMLSTSIYDEGRYALQIGDRGAAIHAFEWYLALRSEPDSALLPTVNRVRTELASLTSK